MAQNAAYWIEKLGLEEHPEGGYFAEAYRSAEIIPPEGLPERYGSQRSFGTSIYFLLKQDRFSAFHRVKSDESWHYYTGNSSVLLYSISPEGVLTTHLLGPEIEKGQQFQLTIPANHWFAAQVDDSLDSFALVGCTVAPGFDYQDFELAERASLTEQYPEHQALIEALTRS